MNDLRRDLEKVHEDVEITLTEMTSLEVGGAPNTIQFLISGDKAVLDEQLDDITTTLEDMKNVTDVTNSEMDTQPELQITVDQDKAREKGMVPAQLQ